MRASGGEGAGHVLVPRDLRRALEGRQKATRSPPFRARISRASSGDATSSPRPSIIFLTCVTWLALRGGELAPPDPETVLEADANIAAHRRGHRRDRHLVASRAEHRPAIIVAEQPVGRPLHMHHVVGMSPDAAEQPEAGLDEQGRLHQALGEEVVQIVEMAGVVALEFVARAGGVQRVESVTDVLEAVAEHEIMRALQHLRLPVVLKRLEALEHRKQAEIHRPHVQRGDFGLPLLGRPHPLLDGHVGGAAGRQIDHDVRRLLDSSQERLEGLRALVRAAVDRIARVQVDNRCAGLRRAERALRDFLRRDRQVRRHRGRMDRAGDGATDDNFTLGHVVFLLLFF